MVENTYKDTKMVTCDSCGDGWEESSWYKARDRMEQEGWIKRKVKGKWTHYCPECGGA